MSKVARKFIVINTRGPIYPLGGVYGPITSAYSEDVDTISRLLMGNYKVEEVLENGDHVVLNLNNYDTVNAPAPAPEPEVIEPVAPAVQPDALVTKEAAVKEAAKEKLIEIEKELEEEVQVKVQQPQQQKNQKPQVKADVVTKK
jgi:hypothetical protein